MDKRDNILDIRRLKELTQSDEVEFTTISLGIRIKVVWGNVVIRQKITHEVLDLLEEDGTTLVANKLLDRLEKATEIHG